MSYCSEIGIVFPSSLLTTSKNMFARFRVWGSGCGTSVDCRYCLAARAFEGKVDTETTT